LLCEECRSLPGPYRASRGHLHAAWKSVECTAVRSVRGNRAKEGAGPVSEPRMTLHAKMLGHGADGEQASVVLEGLLMAQVALVLARLGVPDWSAGTTPACTC